MHIPEDVLQAVKDAANIRQVVSEYVPLKKRGRNWVGLCPFHPDKDPSFSVNEDKQIFYCFGCGEGGNAIKFLMKMQGLSFVEAVKALAGRYGITIPERPVSAARKKKLALDEELIRINEEAADFFHANLLDLRTAQPARDYLADRGMTQELIERFRLGWAMEGRESLLNHLQKKNIPAALAEKAGLALARRGGKGHYDRFRGRIMFPIRDWEGRTVAFGGRILPGRDSHEQPKYINSPETPVYNKRRVLYGLYQNKSVIRKAGFGIVVEGYMDLLALVQAGVGNVAATLGTALTEQHVNFLKRVCNDWVVVFDGDAAGQKAAVRALPLFYGRGLNVKVFSLPPDDDPDTFIRREGKDAWEKEIQNLPSGLDFVIDRGIALYGTDPEGKYRTVEDALSLIADIEDSVKKSLLASRIAQKTGVREDSLWERITRHRPGRARRNKNSDGNQQESPAEAAHDAPNINSADAKLLGFLLAHPAFMEEFADCGMELWLENAHMQSLWNAMLNLYRQTSRIDMASLSEALENLPSLRALAMRLSAAFPPGENPRELCTCLKSYCESRKKKALRLQVLEELKAEGGTQGAENLLKKFQHLL